MILRVVQFGFLAAVLSLVTGCAPEATEVCNHAIKIMESDPDRPGWLDDVDKCTDRMEGVKKRHGVNSYRREVECLLGVDTSYKVRTCIETEERRRM